MRSRNGNHPFLFTALALSAAYSLSADNYYIGYRLTAKNTQTINETLLVSKAMKPCGTAEGSDVLILQRSANEKLESLLQREEEIFIQFAASQDVKVKSDTVLHSLNVQSIDSLTLPMKCYAVEFNNESVTIVPTK